MPGSKRNTGNIWQDPDDAPELTHTFFEQADLYDGERLVRRGRPRIAQPKVAVSLRLPQDVLARWKASGPGWQTRMIEVLRQRAPENA
jgi:uncharacterized protein (DUF4415 family)